jgi:hypothetical protein
LVIFNDRKTFFKKAKLVFRSIIYGYCSIRRFSYPNTRPPALMQGTSPSPVTSLPYPFFLLKLNLLVFTEKKDILAIIRSVRLLQFACGWYYWVASLFRWVILYWRCEQPNIARFLQFIPTCKKFGKFCPPYYHVK